VAAKVPRSFENLREQIFKNRYLGHLKRYIARVTDNLRANPDQLLPQRRHGPVADRLRRRQRAQEVAEIAGECAKLKANRVGGVRAAGNLRPFDRALALFDPLLARAALVVEGEDVIGAARHIGDDESDARIKLARMPLDLGDDPARLRPACGSVVEIGAIPPHMVRRPPDRTLEQVADSVSKRHGSTEAGSRI
jgi:hypothetical protein